jgi:hypothetical protein
MPNYYFNEKLAQAHNQNLLREAAQERLTTSLPGPRSGLVQHLIARMGTLLVALGTRLKRFALSKKTVARA